MPTVYNAADSTQTLREILADPQGNASKLKGELYSRVLEECSRRFNAFKLFTSVVNPKSPIGAGVRSIFAQKTELKAGGADTVNFNIIGPPAGPGAQGGGVLVGNTSRSKQGTYPIRVGWQRDAITYTKDQVEILSAGRSLVETSVNLLGFKKGMFEQNYMQMRLIKSATSGNTFRPGNAASTDAIKATDTLSLSHAHSVRARLNTQGAKPISSKLGNSGSPLYGYLLFASDMAMLPIRNDDGFQNALAQGAVRGDDNALFTGVMTNWGGMPWYELPSCDEAWDDYIGSPLLPKARICKDLTEGTTQFSGKTAVGTCVLKGHSTNLLNARFFQFFPGYDYLFTDDQAADTSSTNYTGTYYAWAINPDGTVAFVSYTGSGNIGTQITVAKILSPDTVGGATGVSTKAYATVGRLNLGTGAIIDATTRVITLGTTGLSLPSTGWTYVDRVDAGAVLIWANQDGVQIGRSFGFGAMAACYAYGRIEMNPIEQSFDFEFEKGRGYEMIFGAGVCLNPYGKPVGYTLMEHAIEHEGYPTPSYNL